MGILEARGRQDKIAFAQYRAVAWTTGVVLASMTLYAIGVYVLGVEKTGLYMYGWQLHGLLYMIFLAYVARISIRERWPMVQTVLVALSGTVPAWGILMERKLTSLRAATEVSDPRE